jgi:hypothetical protein
MTTSQGEDWMKRQAKASERMGSVEGTGVWRRSALVAALLALVALFAIAPAGAAATPPMLWQRCDGGEDDIGCSNPRGVATAPATAPTPGHVYVADNANLRVVEFTAWGEFVRTWGWDVIASGPDDNGTGFEVCVPANGDTCKPGTFGNGAGQFGSLSGPQGVAIDSAGNVYVVDRDSHRVQKFSPSGEFLLMWGKGVNSGTSGNAELCTNAGPPTDVCGAGGEGTGNGQFGAWPVVGSYIAVGPSNKVYVGDVGRVQQFDTNGNYQSQISAGLAATDKVKSLAVDSAGNVYAAIEGQENVRKWNSAGVAQASVTVTAPRALATDAAKNLYVVDGGSEAVIRKFNSSGVEQESWGQEEPPTPKLAAPTGIATGSACLGTGADVYVTSGPGEPVFLRAYGAAPTKLATCPKPAKPPNIAAQYALSTGTTEAVVQAQINPRFWGEATYYVQYGTAACVEGGGWEAACVEEQPAPPGSPLGPGVGAPVTTAAVPLSGLSPDTDYRFRFAAQSGGGGPVFGLGGEVGNDGAEGTFHTFASPSSPPDSCPNALLRSGPGAQLPDCRAYEMVSPVDKGGGDIVSFVTGGTGRSTAFYQSSQAGDKLAYSSFRSFGDAQAQPYTTQYIAGRDPGGGWSSHGISPPRGTVVGSTVIGADNEFKVFSPDLCSGWQVNVSKAFPPLLTPDTAEGTYNLYRRANCGAEGYQALGSGEAATGAPIELQSVSGDGAHAVFRTRDHLSQDAAVTLGLLQCENASTAGAVSYQWLRDGTPIGGKTSSEYTVNPAEDEGKTIQCQVTVTDAGAGATQIANPAWVIAPYPETAPPEAPETIAPPSASEALAVGGPGGQTLDCDPDAAQWEGSPSFSYQWYRNGAAIAGATEPTYTVQAADLATAATFQCEAIGENAGGRVAKVSENALTAPPPGEPAPPQAGARSGYLFSTTVYESYGNGQLRSVCVRPGTQTAEGSCSAGSASGEFNDGRSMSVAGAISADGSRIFWSDSNLGLGQIFARIDGAQTIAVSSGPAQFWGAARDGSAVLFGEGENLYRLDVGKALAEEAGAKTLIAHKVKGVLGASENLARIYLVSKEVLTGEEENSAGDEAIAGEPNLYLYEGGGFAFVGTLSTADARTKTDGKTEPSPINVEPYKHSARVTPDGGAAAFMSSAPLTGYDNTDVNNGEADAEVYRYEAASGQLECVSCNPSGARPAGRNIVSEPPPFLWAAARIPGAETELYAPRALSEDGSRLFFDSFEPLVLSDTNGKEDAYEWEAVGAGNCSESSPAFSPSAGGCISLLSSGKSPQDSEFLEASPSGEDVFIRTGSSLLAKDPGQIDIYDARVEGGFAEAAPKPPCEGEACQSPPPPPEALTPASSAFRGAGNAPPRKHRHKHHKHRKHRKRGNGQSRRAQR